MKALEGLLVLDFSQFLAGPSAALRLADLGARVIKVERPRSGDSGRNLVISNLKIDDESAVFQTINRNKESYAADLKNPEDLIKVKKLIARADVMIQNFRPGIMQRLGLDYETVKSLNPRIVYASVTGYGNSGPWVNKPGQDLLVQSLSGLVHLNGNDGEPPQPFGLAVADLITGAHLAQGIMASLIRRGKTGTGAHVEVSLLESLLDFQFEVITTHLNDGGKLPKRSAVNNAHAYLGAPYGVYATKDGYLSLAMGSILVLGKLLDCSPLLAYTNEDDWFDKRDEIKLLLSEHLAGQNTDYWLSKLEPADYWCAKVLDWEELFNSEGFQTLEMIQTVRRAGGTVMKTTRCPISIDAERLTSSKAAPILGEDTAAIDTEFQLREQ